MEFGLSYDAGSITVLEGLEAVRKRPGMYIGSTGERGLHHLVYEVVDNAVDEALAGFCDRIVVTLLADDGVRVVDNGRGIPVDRHPVEKRPAVEVVLTTLHSGGKFLTMRDERETVPTEVHYQYRGGIEDFVRHLNATKEPIHKSVIGFSAEGEDIAVEVAMQWNATYAESVYTFANTINTHEGGTHEEGFRTALTNVVNKYAADKKLLKEKEDRLTGDDIREGLAAIVSVKLKNPQFEGQTKTKLGNTEAKFFVQKACNEWLADW